MFTITDNNDYLTNQNANIATNITTNNDTNSNNDDDGNDKNEITQLYFDGE